MHRAAPRAGRDSLTFLQWKPRRGARCSRLLLEWRADVAFRRDATPRSGALSRHFMAAQPTSLALYLGGETAGRGRRIEGLRTARCAKALILCAVETFYQLCELSYHGLASELLAYNHRTSRATRDAPRADVPLHPPSLAVSLPTRQRHLSIALATWTSATLSRTAQPTPLEVRPFKLAALVEQLRTRTPLTRRPTSCRLPLAHSSLRLPPPK